MKPEAPLTIVGGILALPQGLRPGAIRCVGDRIAAIGDVAPKDTDLSLIHI